MHDLLPLPALLGALSFLLRGEAHGCVASLPGPHWHSLVVDLIRGLVLLQMTSGDPYPEPHTMEYT